MPSGINVSVLITFSDQPFSDYRHDSAHKFPSKPWNAINHAKRIKQQRKHIRWSHAKRFGGYFPSLQIQVFLWGVTGKLKGIALPSVSLSLRLVFLFFFLFFFVLSTMGVPVIAVSQRESQNKELPSVPQGTWEKVGISLCWQSRVSVFTLHTSCQRVSGWDRPTHG